MCGIVGCADWTRDIRLRHELLSSMTATMSQRGPDAVGAWSDRHVNFGHRRLSIIDIDGGAQPMVTVAPGSDSPIVLAYNGAVYNFRELRSTLEKRGHSFETRSDTEVVLRSYVEWGESFVRELEGMFAIAIWDGRSEELILCRDRLGVKPLYYAEIEGGLLFGSEPKALIAHPEFAPVLDSDGISELFTMVTAPTPGRSPLRGLLEVRPGWLVRASRAGVRTRQYWRLEARPHVDGVDETVRSVRKILADVVPAQLVSDVGVGVLLSGGLDSSAIAALAAESAAKLSTYSVDFRSSQAFHRKTSMQQSVDSPFARVVAAHIGSRHREVVLDVPEVLDAMAFTLRARDLPGFGDGDSSFYLLCRELAHNGTKVALVGEAGDELFGGYPAFQSEAAEPSGSFPWYARSREGLAVLLHSDVRAEVQPAAYVARRYEEALDEVPRLAAEGRLDRRMREVSHLYLTRLLPMLLSRADRLSMLAGVEVRVPFCDHRLMEYVWNIPWEIKNLGGEAKGLLRRSMADLLPTRIINRPKSAYPSLRDPAYVGNLREQVRAVMADRSSRLHTLLDGGAMSRLCSASATPPPVPMGAARALAFVLELDEWLRNYNVRLA